MIDNERVKQSLDYASRLEDHELRDQRLNRPPLWHLVCEDCYRGWTGDRYLPVIAHVVWEESGKRISKGQSVEEGMLDSVMIRMRAEIKVLYKLEKQDLFDRNSDDIYEFYRGRANEKIRKYLASRRKRNGD